MGRTGRKTCAQHACGHVESGNEAHTTVQALGSVSFPGKMAMTVFRVITSHDGVLILFLNKSHLKLRPVVRRLTCFWNRSFSELLTYNC